MLMKTRSNGTLKIHNFKGRTFKSQLSTMKNIFGYGQNYSHKNFMGAGGLTLSRPISC